MKLIVGKPDGVATDVAAEDIGYLRVVLQTSREPESAELVEALTSALSATGAGRAVIIPPAWRDAVVDGVAGLKDAGDIPPPVDRVATMVTGLFDESEDGHLV